MPITLSLLSESQKVKSYNNWFVTIRETNHQQGLQSCLLIQLVENGHQAAPPPSHIIIRTVYCEGILSFWLSFPECSSWVEIYSIEVSWILQEPRSFLRKFLYTDLKPSSIVFAHLFHSKRIWYTLTSRISVPVSQKRWKLLGNSTSVTMVRATKTLFCSICNDNDYSVTIIKYFRDGKLIAGLGIINIEKNIPSVSDALMIIFIIKSLAVQVQVSNIFRRRVAIYIQEDSQSLIGLLNQINISTQAHPNMSQLLLSWNSV